MATTTTPNTVYQVTLDFREKFDNSEAKTFLDENLVHQVPMSQALEIFERLYNKACNYSIADANEDAIHTSHSNLSIFGSRGAGKTSFMLTFYDKLKDRYNNNVLFIPPFESTHMENKQNHFINIVASIHQKVQAVYDSSKLDPRNKRHSSFKKYLECKEDLLKGLSVFDNVGDDTLYKGWDDDDFISMKGLQKAAAANNLERAFHKYVQETLAYLDKKCIVVAFDDIDTDFKRGYELLEVIRKYLTTPQIITVLTGDQSIYTRLIRKNEWEAFGQEYLEMEKKYSTQDKNNIGAIVDQLVSQYIIKILKPENRIYLSSIRDYLDAYKDDYKLLVKYDDKPRKLENIEACYTEMLNALGAISDLQGKIVRHLTELPLRIQIRVLTTYGNYLKNKNLDNFVSNFISIFSSDIYQKATNGMALLTGSAFYSIEMLRFLLDNWECSYAYNFLPITHNTITNNAMLAIGMKFNQLTRTYLGKALVFEYWLRICYIKAYTERIGIDDNAVDLRNFIEYTRFNANAGLVKSIGLAHAYYNAYKDVNNLGIADFPGTIYIGHSLPELKGGGSNMLSLMPILGTTDIFNNQKAYLSIYHLLAVMTISIVQYDAEKQSKDKVNIEGLLKNIAQFKLYYEPMLSKTSRGNTLDEFKTGSTLKTVADTTMPAKYGDWIESGKDIQISVQQANRIFTRLYYSILNIENNRNYHFAGKKFNDMIVALMNAAIVDFGLEHRIPGINLDNAGDIVSIFMENWRHFKETKLTNIKSSFAWWLVQCPLLRTYLNPFILDFLDYDREVKSEIEYLDNKISISFINKEIKRLDKEKEDFLKIHSELRYLKRYKEKEEEEEEKSEKKVSYSHYFRPIEVKTNVYSGKVFYSTNLQLLEDLIAEYNDLIRGLNIDIEEQKSKKSYLSQKTDSYLNDKFTQFIENNKEYEDQIKNVETIIKEKIDKDIKNKINEEIDSKIENSIYAFYCNLSISKNN